MMNQKPRYFKPELSTPYTIALKYPTPRQVNGFAGPELRWTLTDGHALYTPLDFAAKLEDLNIKPGQRFQIEKRIVNRKAEWFVSDVSDPRVQPKGPQKAAALIEAAGALEGPEGALDPIHQPGSSALEAALKTAVTAAAEAERLGQSVGYTVRFSPADIRAMAISVLIQNGRAA